MSAKIHINTLFLESWKGQVLSGLSISCLKRERLVVVGPNGAGKSYFLNALIDPSLIASGSVIIDGSKVAYLEQNVSEGFNTPSIIEYLLKDSFKSPHEAEALVESFAKDLFSIDLTKASGGEKKRAKLLKLLLEEPEILLLDEPTNHLDIERRIWLEKLLKNFPGVLVVVSHDRSFLESISTHTLEINPLFESGYLYQPLSFNAFLETRAQILLELEGRKQTLSSQLRRETAWMQSNAKARTTKQKARQDAHSLLTEEQQNLSQRTKIHKIALPPPEREKASYKLLQLQRVKISFGERCLFHNLDLLLTPGMRVAIVGKNGIGKSTLLKAILGEFKEYTGTIKWLEGLEISYFDQHKTKMPHNVSLERAIAPDRDTVDVGNSSMHVAAFAKQLGFLKEHLKAPVEYFSRGELAKLMLGMFLLKKADLLLLDEPTNDLDIPTLEFLENFLNAFEGAIFFVSHDRTFMQNVATHYLTWNEEGNVGFFVSYEQFLEAEKKNSQKPQKKLEKGIMQPILPTPLKNPKPQKLTFKEKQELDTLPKEIERIQHELEITQEKLSITQKPEEILSLSEKMHALSTQEEILFEKWLALEEKRTSLETS